MDLPGIDLVVISALGLVGGTLGGLLGLGGSVFFIPALSLAFGPNQHLYQASALIANIFVASAAAAKHRGRGTIRVDIASTTAIAAALAALAGVAVSNAIPARPLMALFGAFLCYCAIAEMLALLLGQPERSDDAMTCPTLRSRAALIGVAGGFAAGLLGIGGGAIMVPLFRKVLGLPLRQSVATSAVVMIMACTIAAFAKNSSIGTLAAPDGTRLTLASSLSLAMLLAPSATVGGLLGAMLVYRLPLTATRIALGLLLGVAGARMVIAGLG